MQSTQTLPSKRIYMPKVGKKHFAYTPKGVAAAKAEAARTGNPMKNAIAKYRKMNKR